MERLLITSVCLAATVTLTAQAPTVIRGGTLIDGKGGVLRNVTVIVDGGRIKSVGQTTQGPVSYDLSRLTLLPGLIDTHVHIDTHFGKSGKATSEGEMPQESMLYAAENAYAMLSGGFTTTQSLGSPLDRDLRDAIGRGILPGPRLLTSISPITDATGNPDQIRQFVRQVASQRRRCHQDVCFEEHTGRRRPDADRRTNRGRLRRSEAAG